MTYAERLERRRLRAEQRAESWQSKAEDAYQKEHAILDRIPAGQPILSGHHSESRHRGDLARSNRLRERIIEASDKAEDYAHRAQTLSRESDKLQRALQEPTIEDVDIGDTVTACFTNCGYIRRFPGVIVDRTRNVWKVKALESPYADQGEQPGRIYQIPIMGRPRSSANNRVYKMGAGA